MELTAKDMLLSAAYKLPDDFQFEIEDWGHNLHFNSQYHPFRPGDLVMALRMDYIFSDHDAEGLIRAWEEGKPITELEYAYPATEDLPARTGVYHRVPFNVSRYNGHEKCSDCGHRDFYTDGFKIWPSRSCPVPEGLHLKVQVPIPSGRIMVGNDFRNEFRVEDDDFYVNEASEIARCIQEYAKVGMFHFFVGNSSPGVYRKDDGSDSFAIANPEWDEESEEAEEKPIPGYKFDPEASVCTDLWWVSMVDADEAEKRGLSTDGPGWTSNDILDVEPGVYELEYNVLKRGFDRDAYPVIYATLTRVADCDRLK